VNIGTVQQLLSRLPDLKDLCMVNTQEELDNEQSIQEECERRGVHFHLTFLHEEEKPI